MYEARPKVAIALLTALAAIGLLITPTTALGSSSPTVYRLNVGGRAIAAEPEWARDTSSKPSVYVTSPTSKTAFTRKSVSTSHSSLPSGTPSSMFTTMRNAPSNGAMSFAFPVSAGNYEVRLYFAEIRAKQMMPGARVMSVAIENSTTLSNYDVFKDVGGHRGVMKSFTVTSDNNLDVRITATQGRPMVNGLEIVSKSDGSTEPQPVPSPEPAPAPVTPCTGTWVPAGTDLHALIDNVENQTFCLEAGSYNVGDAPLTPGDNVTIAGAHGTRGGEGTIDAPTRILGSASLAIIEAGENNTFRWLDVSGSNPGSACQPDCGRGIKSGAGMLVEYSRIHHNSNNGIGGGIPSTVTVRFSELDSNGADEFKGTYGAIKQAATKMGGVLIVTDSYVHDNVGLGIWGDRCQDRMIVERNLVVRNTRDGIRWETDMAPDACSNTNTRSALIQYNTARGNGIDPSGGDAGIKIRNSPNAIVGFNTTGANEELGIKVLYNEIAGANVGNIIRDNVSPDGIEGCDFTGVTCSSNT